MKLKEFRYKVYDRIRRSFVLDHYRKSDYETYCRKYKAYRHIKYVSSKTNGEKRDELYMTARPNPKAGIGHQIANWISGYWFAQFFDMKYAYTPFSDIQNPFVPNDWDEFLGFGRDEIEVSKLLRSGWKRIVLPLFDENDEKQVKLIRTIIDSYQGEKVVFFLEQDQFLKDQYMVSDAIKRKFYRVHGMNDKLIYQEDEYNVAVHVRRGDIVQKEGENNPNLTMRWMDNDYFVNAIQSALSVINTKKPIHFYVFSQGKEEDYPELRSIDNITFCLNMDAKNSFLHMVLADALITSKSSFSYKPALLSNGIKFCPQNFWHGYPMAEDWIMLDDRGEKI